MCLAAAVQRFGGEVPLGELVGDDKCLVVLREGFIMPPHSQESRPHVIERVGLAAKVADVPVDVERGPVASQRLLALAGVPADIADVVYGDRLALTVTEIPVHLK